MRVGCCKKYQIALVEIVFLIGRVPIVWWFRGLSLGPGRKRDTRPYIAISKCKRHGIKTYPNLTMPPLCMYPVSITTAEHKAIGPGSWACQAM